MNHSQARDLLPGYALGALESQEHDELLEHLRSCSSCYQLAQEQVEVAAILASSIAEVAPPAGLKGRIENTVAEESRPLESRIIRAEPSFLDRLGLTARWPAFAVSAAAGIAVIMMGVVLAYVLISVGDIDDLQDGNAALTAKLDAQGAAAAASQAALSQLGQSSQALASTLDQQSAVLSSSRTNLEELRQASQGLSVKLDQQTAALALTQDSLDAVQAVNNSLPPALGAQNEALEAAQQTLSDLQQGNRALADQLDQQAAALAASRLALDQQAAVLVASQQDLDKLRQDNQEDLDKLRQDNEDLTVRISDQDEVLAASQRDIEDLGAQNLVLAATATNQQIFTYLQALPVTNKYVLKATANAPGTFGILVTNVANNWGVAVLLGVDPLEPGTVYDLWLEKDGVATHGWFIKKVDPVLKFGQVYAQNFPTPVNQFDRLFVTLEPLGGSPAPTGPELLSATIN